MNRKETEIIVERFFLKRIKDQFTYMPINEALDFHDRKEIQKMIRDDINSKKFRQELQKAFRNDFEDGIRAAFGINRQGKISNYVVDKISNELSSGGSRRMIADICKEVIAKLYKEIALRYPFIIKNLKL
tara:strand:- start:13 stop:402 length:390 start_codon:yes stop_codon:yes gene_type:complete